MAENLPIRKIIDRIISGEIRIPAFQREFVWSPEQVSFLLDSIYKNFPIGTVFLWKTHSRLESERELGNYSIPEPRKEHPVYYVLDGQQRITSLFSVFQTELKPVGNNDWLDIYYDFNSDSSIQESKFVALLSSEVDEHRHFPMSILFNTSEFFKKASLLDDKKREDILNVQRIFQEYTLPIQEYETDSKENIAIVFERINRAGTPLNTFQLLTAWSWSSDFDLKDKFEDLSYNLEPLGFGKISEDKDLLLKCCAAVIKGDTSPSTIMSLSGDEIRLNFAKIKNGIEGAIDFLKRQLKIHALEWMPYPSMIISLSAFFAVDTRAGRKYTDKQREQLIRWFWKSSFSRRYNSGIQDKHRVDIRNIKELLLNENKNISNFECNINESFFKDSNFGLSNVNTKTFILMLAHNNPKSFISGDDVSVEKVLKIVNRAEFHHIFPKRFLEKSEQSFDRKEINCLSNFCFLNNADNQKIKDKDPKEYKCLLRIEKIDAILDSALCPRDSLDLEYRDFIDKRAKMLVERANELIGL